MQIDTTKRLILLLSLLITAIARADDLRYTTSQYAVYSDSTLTFGGRTNVTGRVGSTGTMSIQDDSIIAGGVFSGADISVRYRVRIDDLIHAQGSFYVMSDSILNDSVQAISAVTIRERVTVSGDVTSSGSLNISSNAQIRGTSSQGDLPHTWAAPTVQEPAYVPGSTPVNVSQNQTDSITPGSYGNISLGHGATLVLTAGTYRFASINTGNDGRIRLDDTQGRVTVYVDGAVSMNDRTWATTQSGDGTGGTWYIGGNLTMSTDTRFAGITQVFGSVSMRDRVMTNGGIYAQDGFTCGYDCIFAVAEGSNTIFVSTGGSDSNGGTSASSPLRTIQAAVARCVEPGMTIYIAPGTYNEFIQIGTGAGANAVSGEDGNPTSIIADTNGEFIGSGGAVYVDGQNARSAAFQIENIDHWIIQGLTIRNQTQTAITASNAGLSISSCTIEVPSQYAIAAGITGDIEVVDCTFSRNASSGSAISIQAQSTYARSNITISRNDMSMRDELYHSTEWHTSDKVAESQSNTSSWTLGILIHGGGSRRIAEIDISNNQISDFAVGIGIYSLSDSVADVTISNNTVTGSMISIGTSVSAVHSLRVNNSIIDTCYYGLLAYAQQTQTLGVAGLLEYDITYDMAVYQRAYAFDIIEDNPRFADPAAGDFALQRGSPAIDAGTGLYAPTLAINSDARPLDGDEDGVAQHDLGCWEKVVEPTHVRVIQWREIGGE